LKNFVYIDPHFFDPCRLKSSAYINPPPYHEDPTSPLDGSSNPAWPYTGCPRPASNSFSEVENQQQQLRLHPQLTTILSGPSTISYRNPTRFSNNINFPQQTLYSINQSTNENLTPPTKSRLSLADFPVEEIKGKNISLIKFSIFSNISIQMIQVVQVVQLNNKVNLIFGRILNKILPIVFLIIIIHPIMMMKQIHQLIIQKYLKLVHHHLVFGNIMFNQKVLKQNECFI